MCLTLSELFLNNYHQFIFNIKYVYSNSHDLVETWRELEKLVKLGLIRSIGVCNFNSVQIDRLLSAAEIRPVVNKVMIILQKKTPHDINKILLTPIDITVF